MADNIFDPNGNYNPNILPQNQWQSMGGQDATIQPAPMQGQGAPATWWSQNSPGGQASPGGTTGGDWIGQALSEAQSTDDPAYWRRVIANDPKVAAGDQGAIDYWRMRIARGDGALAVRQGQMQPYGAEGGQAGGGGGGFSGMSPTDVMAQDPGYQFGLGQGLDAYQRLAAAKGTLLTGGTLKGAERYAQDYASTKFNDIFNRNLSLANLGQFGATGTALGYSNAGQAAGQYGQNMANAYTGQGNAAASGTVGSANAWNGSLSQLGQLAALYALQNRGGSY